MNLALKCVRNQDGPRGSSGTGIVGKGRLARRVRLGRLDQVVVVVRMCMGTILCRRLGGPTSSMNSLRMLVRMSVRVSVFLL